MYSFTNMYYKCLARSLLSTNGRGTNVKNNNAVGVSGIFCPVASSCI